MKKCREIADLLDIEFVEEFVSVDNRRYFDAVHKLKNHLNWVSRKYNSFAGSIMQHDPKWTEALSIATETQIVRLNQLIALLDNEPALCDREGNSICPNDLVVVLCQDEQGRSYEHYGIVRATSTGYRVAHFFTGETVRLQNRIAEMGVGYVHFTPDLAPWMFKERPIGVTDTDIESRITKFQEEIRIGQGRLWNKLTYNCEHWAREMVFGKAHSTQLARLREEARSAQAN